MMQKPPSHHFYFEGLGTKWDIETAQELTAIQQRALLELVETFDKTYSRFRNDSLVSHMAHEAGEYLFPATSVSLFLLYEDLYKLTDGKVTPLIGDMLAQLGYDATYSFRAQSTTPTLKYDAVVHRKGARLAVSQPTMLDMGAAGKGYLVDLLAAMLDEFGVTTYVVDGSGDLLCKGGGPLRIGLEDPRHAGRVIGEVTVKDGALCASATNRRRWGKGLHHIVNPHTQKPVEAIVATWVVASSTLVADGIATALFFCSPQTLMTRYNFDYVILHLSGEVEYSKQLQGVIY